MNVYDFDGTIYRRDSSVDFYRFVLARHPGVLRDAPRQVAAAVRYRAGRIDKTAMKTQLFSYLRRLRPGEVQELVRAFWDAHEGDMHAWYAARRRPDDVVISASPEFLLRDVCDRLGVRTMMASRVDPRTGAFEGPNCHDVEKVRRLRERFPDARVEEFYSDSLSDQPLADVAERAWLVRGERLEPWPGK